MGKSSEQHRQSTSRPQTGSEIRDALRELVARHLPSYDGRVHFLTIEGDHHEAHMTIAQDAAQRSGLIDAIERHRGLRLTRRYHAEGGSPEEITLTVEANA